MRIRELLHLYRGWVRSKPARETMAIVGIAVGVALVFATVTANLSIAGSANRIITSLAGTAQLQATSRTPNGVPTKTLDLAGITTANALEAPITINHDGRTVSTQILGAGARVVELNPTIANVPPSQGLILPASLAKTLQVRKGSVVTIYARGRKLVRPVVSVLGAEAIGPLADSRLAFSSLSYAQELVDLPGRVSTILAKTQHGQLRVAERKLRRLVEPGMEVTNTTSDIGLLREALGPQDQSTLLFALLGALVGLLLIVTTTMLTLADRRTELTELRLMGYSPRQLVRVVLTQGIVLGGTGSLLGIVAGWVLAVSVFRSNPDYLASAFPLGMSTIVSLPLAIGVWAGGVLATCCCVSTALFGSDHRFSIDKHARTRLFAIGLVLLAASLILVTRYSLLAALLLAIALFVSIPAWLSVWTKLAGRPETYWRWLTVAANTIKGSHVRSVGLAATAAIGVFGAIIAQGAHHDLLDGLETGYARYVDSAEVWVASPSDDLATNTFPAANIARLRTVSGVRAIRPYYGGWVDMAGRRVWLIAHSSPILLPSGEIVQGNQTIAEQHLRAGGWVVLSDQLARAINAHIGSTVKIPTPAGPKTYRLAATTTNLGWSSGVLFLPARDYVRYWPAPEPSALEIDGHPNLNAVQRIAGRGLTVQTSHQRAIVADALPRQGLERLSQIAWLLVVAATLAVALALSASIWQRRSELASQRLQSFTPRQLQVILACEALLVVGAGAVLGALAGAYGHFASDRFLRDSTGYPVAWSLGVPTMIGTVILVAIATVLILAIPGRIAARSPLRLALDGR